MNNKITHLTNMAKDLSSDTTGHYKHQLLDTLNQYNKAFSVLQITKKQKIIFKNFEQAFEQAKIILNGVK